MLPYLLLFIAQACALQFNNIFFYKKYQVKAGTSLSASVVYLIVNGAVSAAVSFVLLLVLRVPFAATPYSIIMAAVIVLAAAANLIVTFKAYQTGSIATFNIIYTVGGILINCFWGILFMGEGKDMSVWGYIGIVVMIVSAVLMVERDKKRSNKLFWLFCALALVFNAATSLLSKQHQVEAFYPKVDTYSFSIWIGLIRVLLFALVIPFALGKGGKRSFSAPLKATPIACISSVISGSAYVVTLLVNEKVPIALSSPLGTGMGLLLSAVLPIIFFKEKLSKRQIFGVITSFVGVLTYLISA